ncbi:MAG: FAD-dependent monooxygenase, partial [Bacteroidetes bacterium]|nr:FAD-dependent monooxygenase [Bacteroidota bacterium]
YRLPDSAEPSLISEIAELEAVLTRRAESLGVVTRRGLAVTGFEQSTDEVSVQSGDQLFKGKWLVGCDGGRSVVRKLGGFVFAGTEPEFTGYTARVDIADPEKLQPGRNVTAAGMYLQSQPGYVIIQDFDGGAFHAAEKSITREHVQEVLRRVSGTDVTITALHTATTWTDRARQAMTYRNGRVLLAGDAAHIHSPLGGQGLNLGLGDAMNLGWKLAATIREKAPEGLLDSYHAERYPIGAQVLDWSRAQVAIMRPDPHARALHAIIRDLVHTRDGATYIAGRVWGIYTQYNLEGDHPLTGHSVPNFAFEDGTKIGELMHDGGGILLDFDGSAPLKRLAGEYGEQIRHISNNAKDRLGLSAILIRPDGIVAWACDDAPDCSALKKVADRWFVCDSASKRYI